MQDPDIVRASDSDREAAVERLRVAAAEGRLTLQELTARTEAAYTATTHGELAKVTTDLPVRPTGTPAARPAGRRRIVSVFGDLTRSGSWRAEQELSPISVFGDVELDLRHASVPAGGVSISAISPFGNIEVLVPDGVEVDVGGFTLFGSKKLAVGGPVSAWSPTVRVRAFSLFGSVKVWSP
jgi:Domain of unknown function (DUF1707)/Cell wall-active antibiotics response 4TMS YvqF